MDRLQVQVISITSSKGTEAALQAVCPCGGTSFRVYQIVGHAHYHLECWKCGSSFCPFGADHD